MQKKKNTHLEYVNQYYKGFENSNYSQIKHTLRDSLTIISGDYTTVYTPESYYVQFKWDSVFKPKYKLINIEPHEDQLISTISISSSKFKFLKNNPLILKHKFYFESDKISKIEELEYIDINWEAWQKQVDLLVNWVKRYHPELGGFIHDLSINGAIKYSKAIELYQKNNDNE